MTIVANSIVVTPGPLGWTLTWQRTSITRRYYVRTIDLNNNFATIASFLDNLSSFLVPRASSALAGSDFGLSRSSVGNPGPTFRSTWPALPAVPEPAETPADFSTQTSQVRNIGMRYLGNTERDMRFVDHKTRAVFGTGVTTNIGDPQPRLPALVATTFASISVVGVQAIASTKAISTGVTLLGPDERDPDHTLYRIISRFQVTNSKCTIQLFQGIGPAAPSAAVAGHVVHWPIVLDQSIGGLLATDELVAVAPFGTISSTDYSARAIVFGVTAINHDGDNDVAAMITGQLSVQRLVGPPPTFIDRRK